MTLTLNDMRAALKGQARADEAIFWFCHAWHRGPDSDLYKIMCATDFHPRLHAQKQIENDPEILYGFDVLGKLCQRAYGGLVEFPMGPVKLADVKENDVLVHTSPRTFACIEAGWPCRVYKWHGELGVACAEGPTGASFHELKADANGTVIGFRR